MTDKQASIIAAILIIAGASIMAWLTFQDSEDLKVCQSYGYDMAMTVDNRKYCGKQYSNGHTVWQNISYIKRIEKQKQ